MLSLARSPREGIAIRGRHSRPRTLFCLATVTSPSGSTASWMASNVDGRRPRTATKAAKIVPIIAIDPPRREDHRHGPQPLLHQQSAIAVLKIGMALISLPDASPVPAARFGRVLPTGELQSQMGSARREPSDAPEVRQSIRESEGREQYLARAEYGVGREGREEGLSFARASS